MVPVGSSAKVDSVDLQKVVNAAPAFPRPAAPAPKPHEPDSGPDISASGRLKSTTAAMLDVASRLTRAPTWSATRAVSSDESVVQAVSDQAKPGTYSVAVDALALAQTTASATFSSISTVIGIGTLKIELGGWNASQTTFAMNPNWPKASVTLGPKDTSLERVRDKINSAGIGVIASVVTDATGSRLVLRSTATGKDNGFKIEAQADAGSTPQDANALAAMGFDPGKVQGAEMIVPAQDAKVRIEGRALQSSQNLIEDKASGLSLRVKSLSKQPVDIRVEPDTDAVRDDIQSFAITFNELHRQLGEPGANPGDDTRQAARTIQARVQQAFQAADAKDTMAARLRNAGIRMNEEGRLEIDPLRLERALKRQPQQVQALFTQEADNDPQRSGLARRLADIYLSETQAPSAPGVGALPAAEEPGQTAAGAIFRQKLLEQYSRAEPADGSEPARAERDLQLQAHDA